MATGQDTKLRGAVGEFLVAAELCRRDLLATPFAGNVPYYDIIASGKSGGHVAVQVKAIDKSKWWQFDIRKYLDVHMAVDDKHQEIGEPLLEPYPGLLFVLVLLLGTGKDRFFILTWNQLRDLLAKQYREYLAARNFIRLKNPRSFHIALEVSAVEKFENAWDMILHRTATTNSQS
jgi:hypothetical protein